MLVVLKPIIRFPEDFLTSTNGYSHSEWLLWKNTEASLEQAAKYSDFSSGNKFCCCLLKCIISRLEETEG